MKEQGNSSIWSEIIQNDDASKKIPTRKNRKKIIIIAAIVLLIVIAITLVCIAIIDKTQTRICTIDIDKEYLTACLKKYGYEMPYLNKVEVDTSSGMTQYLGYIARPRYSDSINKLPVNWNYDST